VLFELMADSAMPAAVSDQRELLTGLARDYKRINAPVGELGLSTLAAATFALTADGTQLGQTDASLDDIAARRNDLASRMRGVLEPAAFAGQRADAAQVSALQAEARALLDAAAALPGE